MREGRSITLFWLVMETTYRTISFDVLGQEARHCQKAFVSARKAAHEGADMKSTLAAFEYLCFGRDLMTA
jgi:hypothetical protein